MFRMLYVFKNSNDPLLILIFYQYKICKKRIKEHIINLLYML